ncbi:hypothetical protein AVEN_262224-1 [Araneus ventricosus]|uniref:Uncharacterized protein n=1 Tax=Araneus ventricosus TaxID=182803 RepID=A0A4Y2J9E6_ARAVE|nr:hypothetical protein AVEN_262224-1 [Araneus ventricosus]
MFRILYLVQLPCRDSSSRNLALVQEQLGVNSIPDAAAHGKSPADSSLRKVALVFRKNVVSLLMVECDLGEMHFLSHPLQMDNENAVDLRDQHLREPQTEFPLSCTQGLLNDSRYSTEARVLATITGHGPPP